MFERTHVFVSGCATTFLRCCKLTNCAQAPSPTNNLCSCIHEWAVRDWLDQLL
jgi:hypothetical protein